MIQNARSAESKSFLREIEDALVLIKDEKAKQYFLTQMQEVFVKRNDPNTLFTGERNLKAEFLAYLKQKGYVRTANIWARNIIVTQEAIDELLSLLQQRLLERDIEGVLEIHLQDREINSPHVQFVGIKCEEAESIIAHTLVELKYETSVESALSKKHFLKVFLVNPKARVQDLNTMIDYNQKQKEKREFEADEEIEELLMEFENSFKETATSLNKFTTSVKNITQKIESFKENITQYKFNLQSKNRNLTRIRKRIGRR
ncbi:hypothetical protein [Helicobacter sp.]|uniref:hypothetical protein n=1 Tax=Helicobacter sp. TaxID=218 RepID=UPI0025C41F6C|nr:hypothetical protein [Helicobacter sp.]